MFVRFVTTDRDPLAPGPLGIFRAAGNLRDSRDLDAWTAERIHEILGWFNANLPVPKLEACQWRAVFWFHAECQPMISRLWELVAILKDHGILVELIRTGGETLGKVVYCDQFQIAAMPWNRRSNSRGKRHMARSR